MSTETPFVCLIILTFIGLLVIVPTPKDDDLRICSLPTLFR